MQQKQGSCLLTVHVFELYVRIPDIQDYGSRTGHVEPEILLTILEFHQPVSWHHQPSLSTSLRLNITVLRHFAEFLNLKQREQSALFWELRYALKDLFSIQDF